ncbi:patatin-like phospholipase family protein [Thalassotalea ponticola]|uniref:patatin-like phospholipase family protein n=1 Tax=Thalassotalea ponticola TaxID=1523392 RepID=UPI0025B47B72|nr:patatin-like phospholipase family protein [Thalassotalea ponticola]MDN3652186.1 patatin-like phospholipase family protein [Thalassotalea ponticola]
MTSSLTLYAGKKAYQTIRQYGLKQELFSTLVGASGGPKWFVLAGLDRYFCGEFFKYRKTDIATLGSSAGAWRFSCYAQTDKLAAINRLIDGYAHLSYPKNANKQQISAQSEQLLSYVLGATGAQQIATNPLVHNHIVVARSKGLSRFENTFLQASGLLASAIANRGERRRLSRFYQRVIFSQQMQQPPFDYRDGIDSEQVALTPTNAFHALLATGAIPLLINGVRNIDGAKPGMYRDGGLIDYHFDQPFLAQPVDISAVDDSQSSSRQTLDGLVMYPHFAHQFKPGWFDKYVKHRYSNVKHFDNVLVLSPSDDFINSLPYKKIPDRTDFKHLAAQQRSQYFLQVVQQSEKLADEFDQLCHSPPQNIPLKLI